MEEKEEYYTTNNVASFIKGLAILIAVIGIIASLIAWGTSGNIIIGIVGCSISVLSVLVLYAVGEGLQILDDMKRNTEHIRDYLEREKK